MGRERLQKLDANRCHDPTPAPLPGGEPATGASDEAPLLGGAGGGFMESLDTFMLRIGTLSPVQVEVSVYAP